MNILQQLMVQFVLNQTNQGLSAPINALIPLVGNTPLPLTTANAVVNGTWMVMTGVADAFLGLIVLLAALQMLYGQVTGTVYVPLSEFVPRLILTVILIHVSRTIGQYLILVNNALCDLVPANLNNFINQVNGGPLNVGQNVGLLLIVVILGGLSLIRVIFQAFKRIVLFDILFVLSGPAFLMSLHPLTAPWFSFWARLYIVTIFTQFFQFLSIGLGIQLILNSHQTGAIGIFLAIAMLNLTAEIPQLLSRFAGAQGLPAGGLGTLVRSAMTAAIVFTR